MRYSRYWGANMRVIIFGATGKTGRHAVRRALDDGHETTAFGRSVERLDAEDRLTLARGDVFDAEVVADAVDGHDAVIVCLGSANLKDRTTLTSGTQNIVDAVDRHGVERLVVVSAAGVGDSWAQNPVSSKLMFKTMLRNVFADHQSQEEAVRRSNTNWTIVRPAVLSDKLERRSVTASNSSPTKRIHRAALAGFLVDQLDDSTYIWQAITVTS
ncbi:MAG: NAD(P)H-binding protein [Acidimicrobiales bacterium]|nr:NAD(P)H-binding protein [Acidimicrobiaceae bacterium]MXY02116.1 NAD(P)H-binding protein [Acidimicrobiales bacterium]MYA27663.1 NAD(P)H-binding protein [Acidimicrobiales bacterium]MYB82493.1 NAD(P)H-binding protein [Acidimicrobiales bacterium]MYG61375.1 NAD(P)H-binding protein [Acidimicrobiales bacterium]